MTNWRDQACSEYTRPTVVTYDRDIGPDEDDHGWGFLVAMPSAPTVDLLSGCDSLEDVRNQYGEQMAQDVYQAAIITGRDPLNPPIEPEPLPVKRIIRVKTTVETHRFLVQIEGNEYNAKSHYEVGCWRTDDVRYRVDALEGFYDAAVAAVNHFLEPMR